MMLIPQPFWVSIIGPNFFEKLILLWAYFSFFQSQTPTHTKLENPLIPGLHLYQQVGLHL